MLLSFQIIFGIWLILTVLWQFPVFRKKTKFSSFLILNQMIPTWTFFAPNPGIFDTHLLFRDKSENNDLSEWEEICLINKRQFFHFLWNPNKRKMKLIVDAMSELKTINIQGKKDSINQDKLSMSFRISKGYLIILNCIFINPKLDKYSTSRQFSIAESIYINNQRELIPLYISPFHKF
ncbi:MAG: hypothetical protein ACI87N_003543 [Flavobacteriales bacterium]|jgi:hypothetical protein